MYELPQEVEVPPPADVASRQQEQPCCVHTGVLRIAQSDRRAQTRVAVVVRREGSSADRERVRAHPNARREVEDMTRSGLLARSAARQPPEAHGSYRTVLQLAIAALLASGFECS